MNIKETIDKSLREFKLKTQQGKFGLSFGMSPDDYFAIKDHLRQSQQALLDTIECEIEKMKEGDGYGCSGDEYHLEENCCCEMVVSDGQKIYNQDLIDILKIIKAK